MYYYTKKEPVFKPRKPKKFSWVVIVCKQCQKQEEVVEGSDPTKDNLCFQCFAKQKYGVTL